MNESSIDLSIPEAKQENRNLNEEFMRLFNRDDEAICFRAFPPKGVEGSSVKKHGTLSQLRESLEDLNKDKGIYFVVNAGGDKDADITRFNACFIEDDVRSIEEQHKRLDAAPLPTTARVETRKSVHGYWGLTGDVDPGQWDQAMLGLIASFDSDKAIKNRSRVMRVPGFDHISKDGARQSIRCVQLNPERLYTISEVRAAFPAPAQRKETRGRPRKDDPRRKTYSLEEVASMLDVVPSDDRDMWRHTGIILGREFNRSDEAWALYVAWAAKGEGKKGRNHSAIMQEAFHDLSQQESGKVLTIGTIVKAAMDNGWAPQKGAVPITHLVYCTTGNNFIYRPTVSFWVAAAVDAAVSPVNEAGRIIKASDWLQQHQLVTSITSDPSVPDDYLKGFDCRNGELVEVPGSATFNTYRRSTIHLGDARSAGPGVEHIRKIFNKPGDADQFINYMAHRVKRPWEKPRFALLIGGPQGNGKDTAIELCIPAIGSWNVANIEPSTLESGFNEHAASTVVRISEAANLHEMNKWAFNEQIKVLIAGTPDCCQINPKYGQKFTVRLHCGVILTTNHLTTGIYIPEGDRRYDVIESATFAEMQLENENERRSYFADLWDWLHDGGANHMAAYLHERELEGFNPNGPRNTEAKRMVVMAGSSADDWLDDVLNEMGNPEAVRADWIITKAVASGEKEMDVKRKLGTAIGRVSYVLHRSPHGERGRWRIGGRKVTVYVKAGTPITFDPVTVLSKEPF